MTKPLDFARRLRAVKAFAQREEAAALAAANKRVSNILSKQEHDGSTQVEASLLQEAAEKALFEAVTASQQQVAPLFAKGDYQQALDALATLREPVDGPFHARVQRAVALLRVSNDGADGDMISISLVII